MSIFEKLKNVFEKKDEVTGPRSLSLQELEAWVKQEMKKEKGGGIDECTPIIQEIEEVRDDALEIIKEIDERKFSEEIENRIYKPVKTAKPIFVKGMREALRRIEVKELKDYEVLLSFQKSFANSLKSINNLQGGPGRNVSFVYREEMPKLGTELNSFIDISNKISEIIAERGGTIEALENITSNIKEIKTQMEKEVKTVTKQKTLAKKRKELNKEKATLRKEIKTLEKSDLFKQFLSIQEEVEVLKEERMKLIGRVKNQLNPLKRIFKKFKRIVENGNSKLGKEDLACLINYIEDPSQTFLSENKSDLALLNILKGAADSIESGKLQVKTKEKAKLMNKILVLENNCVEMKERFEEISKKEKSFTDKLTKFKFVARREGLQKKINLIEDDLEGLEKEKKDLENEIIVKDKTIESLLKDTEILASDVMGQGIKIYEGALSSEE